MSHEANLKVNTGYPLVNIDRFDKIPSSPSVTYTKLIPITDGFSNLSTSEVLMQHNIHLARKKELHDNMNTSSEQEVQDDCCIIEELLQNGIVDKDCVLLETESSNAAESETVIFNQIAETSTILNTEVSYSSQSINNKPIYVNSVKKKRTKINTKCVNKEEDFNYSENTARTEINRQHIKTELTDESLYSYDFNSEIIIKEEPNDSMLVEEPTDDIQKRNSETIQNFLNENPLVFTTFCGLPNISMFNALLRYVEDEMQELKGVTKFEQLFSVLTKLHKNEDNLYLNKYIFPPAYVYTVEVLYKKLKLWSKNLPDLSQVPEILTSEFGPIEQAAIIGIQTVHIRSNCPTFFNKVKSVKYIIGYSAFGEVFFVSKAYVSNLETVRLILDCGILRKLPENQWIFFYSSGVLCATQVTKSHIKKSPNIKDVNQIISEKAERYITCVVNRLYDNFKVLHLIPDFMLQNNQNVCFLDKLVYVCCMLLNMLPRVTYK
ncbi:hypothetical protein ILUMI_25515 [Ignelater luminosus]|uniref:DDE Tnp4 domain-containing protein n=1 Tax=Ignelater luminosus TaxID=2038154 RepID=A0A8K0FZK7_IGNLU|nr:hypothetical protein ILUMI_25515 [Ignelater luminosus]